MRSYKSGHPTLADLNRRIERAKRDLKTAEGALKMAQYKVDRQRLALSRLEELKSDLLLPPLPDH